MRHLLCALLLTLAGTLTAADSGAAEIAAFRKAMGSQDMVAKKQAIAALANRSVGNDDEVLPLLVSAVADRQASEPAIAALRARTGLSPASGQGQGGYPGYPNGDSTEAWNAWLSARKAERDKQEALKKAQQAAEEAQKKAEAAQKAVEGGTDDAAAGDGATATDDAGAAGGDTAAAEGDAAPADDAAEPAAPGRDPEFGGLDRIIFRSGGSLLCYVIAKRTDPDGNLASVRIRHPHQGGEEVLSADLIARIEDDVR